MVKKAQMTFQESKKIIIIKENSLFTVRSQWLMLFWVELQKPYVMKLSTNIQYLLYRQECFSGK